jgi:hypothetical protein
MKAKSDNHLETTRRDAIKSGIGAASLVALATRAAAPVAISTASVAVMTTTAQAQQVSATTSNVTEPATGIVMFPDYARAIAQMA